MALRGVPGVGRERERRGLRTHPRHRHRPALPARPARRHRHHGDQLQPPLGGHPGRRGRRHQALHSGVLQGRLGRLAEGQDNQGLPGNHRGPHSWLQVQIEDQQTGTIIVNLSSSPSRYKFRIKVENAYGISDASEESDAFDVGGVQIQDTR